MSVAPESPEPIRMPSEGSKYKRALAGMAIAAAVVGVSVASYNASKHQAELRANTTAALIRRLNKTHGAAILKFVDYDSMPPSIEVTLPNCNAGSTISEDRIGDMYVADASGQPHLVAKDHAGIIKPAFEGETAMDVARAICGQFVDAPTLS